MITKRNLIVATVVMGAAFALPGLAADTDTRGYVYGTVETESGTEYTGILRWGTEESFWDDLFHGSKDELPYMKHEDDRSNRRRIKIFGIPIGYRWGSGASGRLLVARFGDIEEIRTRGGDRSDLVMKSGEVFTVDGGSNDVDATITVQDESLGEVELRWNLIERIAFSPTPPDIDVPGFRLYGKLQTDTATFEGYVQWDKQECLSTDKLDGDTSDGDVSIPMGKIRRIERRSSRASRVLLKDGRELTLEGTNDVNSENRGIYVEDERFGRVLVSWDVFEGVEFVDNGKSGRGYDDYGAGRRLRGTVTDYDDRTYKGDLVFDLDESETWELLNGMLDGVEYVIPFSRIRTIRPGRGDTSHVELRGGTELRLESSQDVAEKNAGVVVLRGNNGREVFVAWRDVKQIDFD